jgi:hypothetical protein
MLGKNIFIEIFVQSLLLKTRLSCLILWPMMKLLQMERRILLYLCSVYLVSEEVIEMMDRAQDFLDFQVSLD